MIVSLNIWEHFERLPWRDVTVAVAALFLARVPAFLPM